MRLRQSNKKKRFGLPDYGLDLDTSDADSIQPRADSSEDEFVVDATAGDEDEADEAQSEQGEEDDNNNDNDFNRPTGGSTARTVKAAKIARTKAKTPAGVKKDQSEHAFTEVPPYPSDPGQRWTRTYIGPIKRWTRFYELVDWWFGDKPDRRFILDGFLKLWWQHDLIPPKLTTQPRLLIAQSGWMPPNFCDDQRSKFRELYDNRLIHQFQQQISAPIDKAAAFHWSVPQPQGGLDVLLGHVSDQKLYHIQQGQSIPFSDIGHPIGDADDEATVTGGWLVDVGGIPISIAWAPSKGLVSQLLAIGIAPFSDQAYHQDLKDSPKESEQKEGKVQILRFEAVKGRRGIFRPSPRAPRLTQSLCFSWGRVSRIQWCPVSLAAEDATRMLGVLCVDGKLRIIGVQNVSEQDSHEAFEEIKQPMILLEPPKEYSIEITCFTWINMNRVVAGLSDGSVIVWSLSPLRILQRHPIHSTAIMDIVSGYPSDPFLVSTVPIGGVLTLTDLSRPSAETTYHPNMMVSLQPNLLSWSPHLRGFASIWPSAFAGNPNLTFLPVRGFPLCRHLITVTGQPTCISVGPCHPYILAGTTDGSIWVFNTLRKLSSHREKTMKVKLFQHEFRAPPSLNTHNSKEEAKSRGVCRVLQGFLPEPNSHPTGVKMAETQRLNRERNMKEGQTKNKSKRKTSRKPARSQSKTPGQPEGEVDEEAAMTTGPGPIVLYEPQTRITTVAWNPNVEFSWWAAAAIGSGLVRVMDIGAEPHVKRPGNDVSESDDENEDENGMDMMVDDNDEEEEGGDVDMASDED
ncbi:hypothetical protein O1611_g9017 [Lasiodiplodia mahajangana]|uniref:Uncharacterized protein n=1 Tax=Lasiodiplodia mahajangana TaxID=1108764 RepID=A0ACC2JAS6_9PEZI|nr:hypothetical protein O1611_g9017 [Lasiodiplodia mahajangana]